MALQSPKGSPASFADPQDTVRGQNPSSAEWDLCLSQVSALSYTKQERMGRKKRKKKEAINFIPTGLQITNATN